jgi:hypothetical protein
VRRPIPVAIPLVGKAADVWREGGGLTKLSTIESSRIVRAKICECERVAFVVPRSECSRAVFGFVV